MNKVLDFIKQEIDHVPKETKEFILKTMKDKDFTKIENEIYLNAISLGLEEAFNVKPMDKARVFTLAYRHIMKGGL